MPSRFQVDFYLSNSEERGFRRKILESDMPVLIQPNSYYLKKVVIAKIEWFDGKNWLDVPIKQLKKGEYGVQVAYNGTKKGMLIGNYDFADSLNSKVIQLEIE